jgi:uncharacterized protein
MASSIKKVLLLGGILVIIAGAISFVYPYYLSLRGENAEKKIVIHQAIDETKPFIIENKGIRIKTDVADTEEERAQGLSGTEFLQDDEGKFFVFERPGYHSFWMKDMIFAIDIIFLDENMIAVDIKKNVEPSTYPNESFEPKTKAKFVLEINAGLSDKYGFSIGDKWKVSDTSAGNQI